MELSYGALLSPRPIKLSIGTLKKPTLFEIYDLTFEKFGLYETFLKITPERLYTEVLRDSSDNIWDSLSDEEKESIKLFDLINKDQRLQEVFCEIFNFFFGETVVFQHGLFLILKDGVEYSEDLTPSDLSGAISDQTFQDVVDIIQQTCCIYEKPKPVEAKPKFKNKLAEQIYEKMRKAKEEQKKNEAKRMNKDYSLPNIISAVSNKHPSISPLSVWDMTVFQLIDSFNRMQVNAVYDINQLRVSVWGDEKKTFDATLWYKNNQENDN